MNATITEFAPSACFELRKQDDVVVLELYGELGSLGWQDTNDSMRNKILSATAGPRPRLVVDLSRVTYVGSEFVEFLLGIRKNIHARGGQVVLAGLRTRVLDVVYALEVNRILPRYPSAVAAVRALQPI